MDRAVCWCTLRLSLSAPVNYAEGGSCLILRGLPSLFRLRSPSSWREPSLLPLPPPLLQLAGSSGGSRCGRRSTRTQGPQPHTPTLSRLGATAESHPPLFNAQHPPFDDMRHLRVIKPSIFAASRRKPGVFPQPALWCVLQPGPAFRYGRGICSLAARRPPMRRRQSCGAPDELNEY